MKIIRMEACRPLAWKNGGGTTRTLTVSPEGAGMDDFLWRISLAQIASPGGFSAFEGVDRVLAVAAGRLRLSGPGVDATLDGASAPLAFDGAATITGTPLQGEVLALNAMARHGAHAITMERLEAGAALQGGEASFFLALEPQRLGAEDLGALDLAILDGGNLAPPLIAGGAGWRVGFPKVAR